MPSFIRYKSYYFSVSIIYLNNLVMGLYMNFITMLLFDGVAVEIILYNNKEVQGDSFN